MLVRLQAAESVGHCVAVTAGDAADQEVTHIMSCVDELGEIDSMTTMTTCLT